MIREEPIEFIECDTCAAKPGMPVLCEGCLSNRSLIMKYENILREMAQMKVREMSVEKLKEFVMGNEE